MQSLENNTQWLENWMREVKAKVKQLDAALAAAKDTTDPSSRAKAASPERGRRLLSGSGVLDHLGR